MESILDKCDRISERLLSCNFVAQARRTGNYIQIDVEDETQVIDQLTIDGHLKRRDNQPSDSSHIIYDFTGSGRIFFKHGGYKALEKRMALTDYKLETDLNNARNVYKSYSSTRFISWASFIIALILGIFKLIESFK